MSGTNRHETLLIAIQPMEQTAVEELVADLARAGGMRIKAIDRANRETRNLVTYRLVEFGGQD